MLCLYYLIYFTMEKGTLTFFSLFCFFKGTRPERDRGSDPHDAGDHQLLPDQFSSPQPQPGVRAALQAGSVWAVSNSPFLPGHHAKYRSGEWYVVEWVPTLRCWIFFYPFERWKVFVVSIKLLLKCWRFCPLFPGLPLSFFFWATSSIWESLGCVW